MCKVLLNPIKKMYRKEGDYMLNGKQNNRIEINLPNGMKLVAEQNQDPNYDKEIYIGIETSDGCWHQDLAIVRNAYSINDQLQTMWDTGKMEVLVYADENDEDYTNKFSIDIYDEVLYEVRE